MRRQEAIGHLRRLRISHLTRGLSDSRLALDFAIAELEKPAPPAKPAPDDLAAELAKHWLFEMICNHTAKTDVTICACGWRSPESPSVGDAAKAWSKHALAEIRRGLFAQDILSCVKDPAPGSR